MASTPIRFVIPTHAGQSGLTLELFATDGDTIVNGVGDTLTETAAANGVFDAVVTEALAGTYRYTVVQAGSVIQYGWIVLADTTAQHLANDVAAIFERPGGMLDGIRSVFAGISLLSSWLRIAMRGDAGSATALAEINTGGGTFDPTVHSLEAAHESREALADSLGILGGVGLIKITVTVTGTGTGLGIAGARVAVSGTSTSETTNTNGIATLYVSDEETYSIIVLPPGMYLTPNPVEIEVDGEDVEVPISVASPVAAEQTDPSICAVQCFIRDSSGVLIEAAEVSATLLRKDHAAGGTAYGGTVTEATTDENGFCELKLLRPDTFRNPYSKDEDGVLVGEYRIEAWKDGELIWSRHATMPEKLTATLDEIDSW
ncbi:hypothetical protein [Novipirellula rosea]|uniref:Cna protein B-type domain protein n=1 Tax=Novipirellula rosea TaxID=1031540 RepID=A0ABP8NHD5_9BACT